LSLTGQKVMGYSRFTDILSLTGQQVIGYSRSANIISLTGLFKMNM
jgi:hypothetical protein